MEQSSPIESGDDWDGEPIGPDDLTIRTLNGTVGEPEHWVALVISAPREPGSFLIVCSGPSHLYAQAINHDGRYLLEFRNGSPDQHFQAEGVSGASIAEALSQWMRGERTFIGDHEWKLLTI